MRHNERRTLKAPRQFRPCPYACDGTPITVRGSGIPRGPLAFMPNGRMGPPLRSFAPMRMTASWFGSLDPPNTRLWRDRSALERGLPSDRHLADPARLRSTVQPCSELSTPSPAAGRRRGDQPCQLLRATASGRRRRNKLSYRTKKLTKEKRCAALLKVLDKKSPIQGRHASTECATKARNRSRVA